MSTMMRPPGAAEIHPRGLTEVPLFAGIEAAELERVEHFMTPFRAPAGEVLFGQGEEGDRVYVVESGSVGVQLERTGGEVESLATIGPGEVLGEMSLLGGARRTGTAVVEEAVQGWVLHRSSFQMLRLDAGGGSVELVARITEIALARLRDRYAAISEELAASDAASAPALERDAMVAAPAGTASHAYLESLLCFRHFHDSGQIERALGGAPVVQLPAGAIAMTAGEPVHELLLVLRGALDVSIRRGHSARRVRLAGPGRFVGHVGALDGLPSPVVAHAREPVVLTALPAARVREMVRDPSGPARRFCAGLADDVARALRQAERPIARVVSRPSALRAPRPS